MHLLLLALATFASEDLACAAAGALIARGELGFVSGTLACLVGICTGDLLLYAAGRLLGRPIVQRFVSGERIDRASEWIVARGARVVLISRFTPGLRLPTYLAAGVLKTSLPVFAGYFLIAALLWTPALVAASAFFGARLPLGWAGVALCVVLILPRLPWSRMWQGRKHTRGSAARLGRPPVALGRPGGLPHDARSGFHEVSRPAGVQGQPGGPLYWKGLARWEFWPVWMAYLPLVPWWLWLAARYRSLTVFMASNPGIPLGGLKGESKSAILSHLPWVPAYSVVPPGGSCEPIEYPVVCKPNTGERGRGGRDRADSRRTAALS